MKKVFKQKGETETYFYIVYATLLDYSSQEVWRKSLYGSSQKIVFPVTASLQKVIQWTTNEVTQTPNYETVAKVEGKMKKVLKQKGET